MRRASAQGTTGAAPARRARPASAVSRALSNALPVSPHTIAHGIASDLGVAIIDGELEDGERVLEEELAAHYGVSRSPVREAIELLERRGLVRTEPRRGTYVVGHSLGRIADLFNVRGVLVALAIRYIARQRDPDALADLRAATQALLVAAGKPETTPLAYAKLGAEMGFVFVRHCDTDVLRRMISDHGHLSGWGMIWRRRPLDFLTVERRQSFAHHYEVLCDLVEQGDDGGAEQWLRKMMFDSRDLVLAELAKQRGGEVDAKYQFTDANPKGVKRR